jgi:hypothetical protein
MSIDKRKNKIIVDAEHLKQKKPSSTTWFL